MPKHCGSSGGGGSARPARLALLTALSLAGTLVYVFVLLVPAWRTVHIDRALIGAFLANQSDATRDVAPLWDALARDPLLRGRSANAFRECRTGEDGFNASALSVDSLGSKSPLEGRLLEALAGLVNGSSQQGKEDRHKQRSSAAGDRCWFLDLHWSASESRWTRMTAAQRDLLRCTRALFLLAVCLLLCYCVCLTGSLYACFAARMAGPCRLVLIAAHCLSLSQLVGLAILQDVSARLSVAQLLDLLTAAGFPDGCAAAVSAERGVCSLVLLCVLCLATAVQMLLFLLPTAAAKRRSDDPIVGAGAACAGDKEDGEKLRECDDAEDTNPLI